MPFSREMDRRSPDAGFELLQSKCFWRTSEGTTLCSAPDCEREGRFTCEVHPQDGGFCCRHRSLHSGQTKRMKAELDSRPRVTVEEPMPPNGRGN